MLIKRHVELSKFISGKRILHLNSLGKDSVVSLEWLVNFSYAAKIISLNFNFLGYHSDDQRYLNYLKKRYPQVDFISEPNGHELDNIAEGTYQYPFDRINVLNPFDHYDFSLTKQAEDVRKLYQCDYICSGNSKYESVARAVKFFKNGLVKDTWIYPLGLLTKKQVFSIFQTSNLKLHPCYKLAASTYDYPSYYKMRSAFITDPEYKKRMYGFYPLLALDEYRFEVLLEKKK